MDDRTYALFLALLELLKQQQEQLSVRAETGPSGEVRATLAQLGQGRQAPSSGFSF